MQDVLWILATFQAEVSKLGYECVIFDVGCALDIPDSASASLKFCRISLSLVGGRLGV